MRPCLKTKQNKKTPQGLGLGCGSSGRAPANQVPATTNKGRGGGLGMQLSGRANARQSPGFHPQHHKKKKEKMLG
jgi:hypothetical protein